MADSATGLPHARSAPNPFGSMAEKLGPMADDSRTLAGDFGPIAGDLGSIAHDLGPMLLLLFFFTLVQVLEGPFKP